VQSPSALEPNLDPAHALVIVLRARRAHRRLDLKQ
jgi:hypothetical protein